MADTGQLRPLVDELRQMIRAFSEQADNLQKGLFALRRVAVSGLFSKFPRIGRSLAQDLGKKIDIVLQGEETEFDKALIEDLDAPLTHIVCNAVDHGIDSPEDSPGPRRFGNGPRHADCRTDPHACPNRNHGRRTGHRSGALKPQGSRKAIAHADATRCHERRGRDTTHLPSRFLDGRKTVRGIRSRRGARRRPHQRAQAWRRSVCQFAAECRHYVPAGSAAAAKWSS